MLCLEIYLVYEFKSYKINFILRQLTVHTAKDGGVSDTRVPFLGSSNLLWMDWS